MLQPKILHPQEDSFGRYIRGPGRESVHENPSDVVVTAGGLIFIAKSNYLVRKQAGLPVACSILRQSAYFFSN
jgi:hypothetical protein